MANPQYPDSRRLWQQTYLEAGQFAENASGQSASGVAAEAIPFGRFVTRNASGQVAAIGSSTFKIEGISGISLQVKNYVRRQYTQGEMVEVMRRGFVVVEIDPDNKPTAFGSIKISYASGKQGMLTTSASDSFPIGISEGMTITSVGETTAVIFLPGKSVYGLGGRTYKFTRGNGANASNNPVTIGVIDAEVGDVIIGAFGTSTDGDSRLSALQPGLDIERVVSTHHSILQLRNNLLDNTYIFILEPGF